MAGQGGTEVSRSLEAINSEIKDLKAQISDTARQARNMSASLEIRPGTLSGAVKQAQSLRTQLSLTERESALLREKLAALKAAGVPETASQIKTLTKQLNTAEYSAAKLTGELKKAGEDGMTAISNGAKKVVGALTGVVAGLVSLSVYSVKTGDDLSDMSQKFGVSVEQIQLLRNQFDKVTGDSSGFDSALSSVQSLLGQVAKGTEKTKTALALLGLSLDDLKGESAGEAFETIMAALSAMPDAAERAAAAQALLGDAGYQMALVAGESSDYLNALNEQMEQAGLITQSEADAAGAAADAWSYLNQALKKAAVALAPTLLPIIQKLTSFLQKLLPFISKVLDFILSIPTPVLAVIGVLGALLAILPAITAAMQALNTAMWTNPAILMFMGVALGGLAIAGVAAAIAGAVASGSKNAADASTAVSENVQSVQMDNEQAGGATADSAQGSTSVDNSTTNNEITINVTEPSDLSDVLDQINRKRLQVGG